jgi:anti-anti-sigma factor
MANLSYIDSSGLRAIVVAQTQLNETGGHVEVSNAPPIARRALEVAGLAEVLSVRDGEPPTDSNPAP